MSTPARHRAPHELLEGLDPRGGASVRALRVAVVGTGYLGRFHAQKYAVAEGAELVGGCDIDAPVRGRVAAELRTRFFADHRDLFGLVDAVTIAATTDTHYELSRGFLEHGIHVLVEEPMTRP